MQPSSYFQDFPGPAPEFQDFPDLENDFLKFKDFPGIPGPVRTLTVTIQVCYMRVSEPGHQATYESPARDGSGTKLGRISRDCDKFWKLYHCKGLCGTGAGPDYGLAGGSEVKM